jgi:hypothetical protein
MHFSLTTHPAPNEKIYNIKGPNHMITNILKRNWTSDVKTLMNFYNILQKYLL